MLKPLLPHGLWIAPIVVFLVGIIWSQIEFYRDRKKGKTGFDLEDL